MFRVQRLRGLGSPKEGAQFFEGAHGIDFATFRGGGRKSGTSIFGNTQVGVCA